MPNPICGSPTCTSTTPNHSHLSMPDPCPHLTRFDLIAAKLNDDPTVLAAHLDHLTNCSERT